MFYGASQSAGNTTWYNQSVSLSGAIKGVSTCKYVQFSSKSATGSWDTLDSPTACPGWGNQPIKFTLHNYEAGGPRDLYITMYDLPSGAKLVRQHCTRSGCEAPHGF